MPWAIPIIYVHKQSVLGKIRLGIEHQRLKFVALFRSKPLSHRGLILALLTGDESCLDAETKHNFSALELAIYWQFLDHMC